MLDQLESRAFASKTLMVVNNCIMHWKKQNRDGLEHFLTAYHTGLETGDLPFAALSIHAYCYNALFTAMPLPELREKMEEYNAVIGSIGQYAALNFHQCYFQTVENLMGLTDPIEHLSGRIFDYEERMPQLLEARDRTAIFVAHFCQLTLGIYLGKADIVMTHLLLAKEYQDGVVALIHNPLLNFYESLHLLETEKNIPASEGSSLMKKIQGNQQVLKKMGRLCTIEP